MQLGGNGWIRHRKDHGCGGEQSRVFWCRGRRRNDRRSFWRSSNKCLCFRQRQSGWQLLVLLLLGDRVHTRRNRAVGLRLCHSSGCLEFVPFIFCGRADKDPRNRGWARLQFFGAIARAPKQFVAAVHRECSDRYTATDHQCTLAPSKLPLLPQQLALALLGFQTGAVSDSGNHAVFGIGTHVFHWIPWFFILYGSRGRVGSICVLAAIAHDPATDGPFAFRCSRWGILVEFRVGVLLLQQILLLLSLATILSGDGLQSQLLPEFLFIDPIARTRRQDRPRRWSRLQQSDEFLYVYGVLLVCRGGCQQGQLAVPVVLIIGFCQGHQRARRIHIHELQGGVQDGFEWNGVVVVHHKAVFFLAAAAAVVLLLAHGRPGRALLVVGVRDPRSVPGSAHQGALFRTKIGVLGGDQGPVRRAGELPVFLEARQAAARQAAPGGGEGPSHLYRRRSPRGRHLAAAGDAGGEGGFRVYGFVGVLAPRIERVAVVVVELARLVFQVGFRVRVDGGVVPGRGVFSFVIGHVGQDVVEPLDLPLLVAHLARVPRQGGQALVQGGKITVCLQNDPLVVGVGHHGQGGVDRQGRVRHQKGIKEPLDDAGVPDVVGEPREDPRQAKEGLHVGVQQVAVDLGIDFSQQGKQDQFQSGLEAQEIRSEGVGEMAKGNLAQHLGREFQVPGRIVAIGVGTRRGELVRAVVPGHRRLVGPRPAQGVQKDAGHVVVSLVVPEPVETRDPGYSPVASIVALREGQVDEVGQPVLLLFQQDRDFPVPLVFCRVVAVAPASFLARRHRRPAVPPVAAPPGAVLRDRSVLAAPRPLRPRQQVPRAPRDVAIDLRRVHGFNDEGRGGRDLPVEAAALGVLPLPEQLVLGIDLDGWHRRRPRFRGRGAVFGGGQRTVPRVSFRGDLVQGQGIVVVVEAHQFWPGSFAYRVIDQSPGRQGKLPELPQIDFRPRQEQLDVFPLLLQVRSVPRRGGLCFWRREPRERCRSRRVVVGDGYQQEGRALVGGGDASPFLHGKNGGPRPRGHGSWFGGVFVRRSGFGNRNHGIIRPSDHRSEFGKTEKTKRIRGL
mmetsp:Transcript_24384/g.49720  ORF Transcript_24384/g.49720 Transcript_24384/m.49720 type:complete len:1063 (+) Transcript_24384:352-3540(+)